MVLGVDRKSRYPRCNDGSHKISGERHVFAFSGISGKTEETGETGELVGKTEIITGESKD